MPSHQHDAPAPQGWWQTPKLRDHNQQLDQRVTWLELFFDLVFVAAVAEVNAVLAHDAVTWHSVGKFLLYYVPIWWIWVSATVYNDRFETSDISHRLFTFLIMIPVAGFALTVQTGVEFGSFRFAICYIIAHSITTLLWFRAGYYNPTTRPVTSRYVSGFALSIACWVASLFVAEPLRYYLWAAGLLIDFVTPLTVSSLQNRHMPRYSNAHMPERFGLFTILVLGESVAGVIHGAAISYNLNGFVPLTAMLGLLLAFTLWWVYFDEIMGHPQIPRAPWSTLWFYAHMVLTAALVTIGAGLQIIIGSAFVQPLASTAWALAGAVAVVLLAIALLEEAHDRGLPGHDHVRQSATIRVLGALTALVIGSLGTDMTRAAFVGLLLFLLMLEAIQGVFDRFGLPMSRKNRRWWRWLLP